MMMIEIFFVLLFYLGSKIQVGMFSRMQPFGFVESGDFGYKILVW